MLFPKGFHELTSKARPNHAKCIFSLELKIPERYIVGLRPCRRPLYMQEPTNLQCCQLWAISIRCLKRDIMWVSLCWKWSDCYHQEECSLFDCNSVHALLHIMWEYILFKAIHLFLLKATWRHWCTVKWGSRFFFFSGADVDEMICVEFHPLL